MDVRCFYGNNTIYPDIPAFCITVSSAYFIIAIPTVVLNLCVLVAIRKTPSLHKPSYVLLACMAAADFMNGLVCEPLMALDNVAITKYWMGMHCMLSLVGRMFGYWTSAVSLFTLTAISVDRLLAVSLKNRYQTVVTVRRVTCIALLFWTLPLLLALVIGISYSARNFFLFMMALGTTVLALLAVIVLCYSMAYYHLNKLTSSISANTSEDTVQVSTNMTASKYRKTFNTMIIVCVTLFLFYVPFLISSIVVFKEKDSSAEDRKAAILFWQITEIIIVTNSVFNPILYLWRMRDLRAAMNTIKKGISCGKCTDAAAAT